MEISFNSTIIRIRWEWLLCTPGIAMSWKDKEVVFLCVCGVICISKRSTKIRR